MSRRSTWSISNLLFDKIELLIPDGSTILELGSGEGTRDLSLKFKMISIEEDEKFIGLYDSHYIHAPVKPVKPTKRFPECHFWYDPVVLRRELPLLPKYNLLIVDGPLTSGLTPQPRGGLWKYKDLFNFDVPTIFDDSHREEVWNLIRTLSSYIHTDIPIPTFEMRRSKAFSILFPNSYTNWRVVL